MITVLSRAFDSLVGHSKVRRYLQRIVLRQIVPHSLLFSGPEGVGKRLFAEAFARLLLDTEKENHPDIHLYRPEGKTGMHSLDTLRTFGREVYLAPYEGEKKVFILDEADRMLPTSANALLKTFEEPPKGCVIILVSSRPEKLLPTILSRCQKVPFYPLSKEEMVSFIQEKQGISLEEAEKRMFSAKGSLGKALQKSEEEENGLERLLLDSLSNGLLSSYGKMVALAEKLASVLDERLKREEKALMEAFLGERADEMTAVQKEAVHKEVEGVLSLRKVGDVKALFESVQGWFRDLHLLRARGNRTLLMHPGYEEVLLKELERIREEREEDLLSLEEVEKGVSQALLSLERSTSLKICFEQLFMRVGKIR